MKTKKATRQIQTPETFSEHSSQQSETSATDLMTLSKDMVKELEVWYNQVIVHPFIKWLKTDKDTFKDEKTMSK